MFDLRTIIQNFYTFLIEPEVNRLFIWVPLLLLFLYVLKNEFDYFNTEVPISLSAFLKKNDQFKNIFDLVKKERPEVYGKIDFDARMFYSYEKDI